MKRSIDRNSTELQQIIADLDLNAQTGEMARAIYRKGRASHSDELRDARKVLFYAQAEVKRLEKLATAKESLTVRPAHPATFDHIDPADVDIASSIDDDSERMQAIGQNGNDGEHYDHERIPSFANCKIKSRTSPTEHFARLDSDGVYWSSRDKIFNMKHWQLLHRIK